MPDRLKKLSTILACAGFFGLILESLPAAGGPAASAPSYLYKITFVRAAPGKLLDLIALYKGRMAAFDASGDERPLWWRHTQGDHWDLMLIFPMGSYAEYYGQSRAARRQSDRAFERDLAACSSWREDLFVYGPPLETVKAAINAAGYYHIEIFAALPGKQGELYQERLMENAYQTAIGRPENMIFLRDQGAAWDLFTLGCYKDLAHWASSSGVAKEQREEAARRAGFANSDAIGPYMRTLIDYHRDTMGVAIK